MTTIENTTKSMTTIHEEDITEIKIKRKPGRPRTYTPEEAKERIKAYDKRRYHADPLKKIALVKANYLRNKESQ